MVDSPLNSRLVFLDSRDLIDCLEHDRPVDWKTLCLRMIHSGAKLLLCYTNVFETIPKSGVAGDRKAIMDRLAQIPHTFLRQVRLPERELKEAFDAWNEERLPRDVNPFVTSWWRTFWKAQPFTFDVISYEHSDFLDRCAIAEQVECLIFGGGPEWFDANDAKRLESVVSDDRTRLAGKRGLKRSFSAAIKTRLARMELPEPKRSIDSFVDTVYSNPTICPGWRTGHECYEEFRTDKMTRPKSSDFPDFSHLAVIAYAHLATLDPQWRGYLLRAQRRLHEEGIEWELPDRVHSDLSALLKHL